jgi:Flp pilus assembly pilin Flp
MNELIRKMWLDQSGQDVAEYALLLAAILAVVVGTVTAIGTQSNTVFTSVRDALTP